MDSLPIVDEHSRNVHAEPDRVWDAVMRLVHGPLARPAPRAFVSLWNLEPVSGFDIADETAPRHVALRGRHRFSRYELAFDVVSGPDVVTVRARTSAEFPGIAGAVYRVLVIGTGGHRLAVRHMLREIARSAERASEPRPSRSEP